MRFARMHGTGSDFVIIRDNKPVQSDDYPDDVRNRIRPVRGGYFRIALNVDKTRMVEALDRMYRAVGKVEFQACGKGEREMARSMTGFGQAEVSRDGYHIRCEIKSVNHRFLDFSMRIPRRYSALEDRVREKVKQHVVRGRVEVFAVIEKTGEIGRNIKVDNELAKTYYNALRDLAQNLEISPEIMLMDVFRLPEVFSLEETEEDLEVLWNGLEEALEEALARLDAMRDREGEALAADILVRNQAVRKAVDLIENRSPQVVTENAERMRKRLAELMADVSIDEARLVQEIALFSDRISVAEEVVRLRSHCDQLESLMEGHEPSGRKGDFLLQEMFREINTIASKANDLQISQTAVNTKAELEKIREQVQNIE